MKKIKLFFQKITKIMIGTYRRFGRNFARRFVGNAERHSNDEGNDLGFGMVAGSFRGNLIKKGKNGLKLIKGSHRKRRSRYRNIAQNRCAVDRENR